MALDNLSREIDIKYLYYYLRDYDFKNIISGSAQPQITRQGLQKLIVKYPSLETQTKIVEVLDKCQALIDARKEQIRLMDGLIQSVFYEMFGDPVTNPKGWQVKKLLELLETQPQNGMYKPQDAYVNDGTGTPILRIDAFYNGKVVNWDLKRLKCNDDDIEKYGLKLDDIVINRVNSIEYLGKCAHIDNLVEPTVYESNMMRFSIDKEQVNPIYLTKLLSHNYVYNQILICAKKAVNQASINQQDVKSFDIVVPEIQLQNEFALKIYEIEKRKNELLRSIEAMKDAYKSIMHTAFKGES